MRFSEHILIYQQHSLNLTFRVNIAICFGCRKMVCPLYSNFDDFIEIFCIDIAVINTKFHKGFFNTVTRWS